MNRLRLAAATDGKGKTHPHCQICGGYGRVLIEINDGGEQWDICPDMDKEDAR